jgi:uncharacterized protein YecE (DUF72 family)
MSNILIGTSGWSYLHWYEIFYPKNLKKEEMLSFYSKQFSTVELNASFYRLPFAAMVESWKKKTPEDFLFAVKASRQITHILRLKDCRKELERFVESIIGFSKKLGPILYQLPPRFEKDLSVLKDFLKILPKDLIHAVEFRNPSWQDEETFSVLTEHNVAYCITSGLSLPTQIRRTADFSYIRMHGPGRAYSSLYSEDEIVWWAENIEEMLSRGCQRVYIYFNNDFEGFAIQNANRLKELLKVS